jgi:hypothetical protein
MENCDGRPNKASAPKKPRTTPDIPLIALPCPPNVTARDIFEEIFEKSLEKNKHKSSNLNDFAGKKAPNKFLIYRKIFVEELHRQNIHHSMTDISGYIAKRWNSETKAVQDIYSKIAIEVDNLRKQRFGTDSRKKSKRQLKSFSAPSVNNVNNTYPITNGIYDNVNNLSHVQEQLDPSNCIFAPYPQYNIAHNTISTSQQIYHPAPHLYLPQPTIYYGGLKQEPNYGNVDGYPTSMVGAV